MILLFKRHKYTIKIPYNQMVFMYGPYTLKKCHIKTGGVR